MKSFLSFAIAAVLVLSGCASNKKKENTISISGAFALYPLVVQWGEEYKKEKEKTPEEAKEEEKKEKDKILTKRT